MRLKLPSKTFVPVICLALTTSIACKEQDRPLDAKTRIYVDTLVEQALRVYQPEADSLCALQYDSIYQWAFDSIMEIRLEQKRALMQYGDVQ